MTMTDQPNETSRPSAAWFALPVALLILTIVAVVALLPTESPLAPVLEAQKVTLPGEVEIELERAGNYYLYRAEETRPGSVIQVTITPVGATEPLRQAGAPANSSYTSHGDRFLAVSSFEAKGKGRVVVTGRYSDGATGPSQTWVVGPALEVEAMFGSIRDIFLCIGAGLLGGLLTILAGIIVVVKRIRPAPKPVPPPAPPLMPTPTPTPPPPPPPPPPPGTE